jgi:ribosomal-protein-alanine acetyltransferase
MIRRAELRDAASLRALAEGSPTAAHWAVAEYERIIAAPSDYCALVAEGNNASAAGFVIARRCGDECEIENIIVEEPYRRRGVATSLMQALISELHGPGVLRLLLEVRESNDAAVAFYQANGFRVASRRKSYYSHPTEDGLLLERLLT